MTSEYYRETYVLMAYSACKNNCHAWYVYDGIPPEHVLFSTVYPNQKEALDHLMILNKIFTPFVQDKLNMYFTVEQGKILDLGEIKNRQNKMLDQQIADLKPEDYL